jgi:hypothetical protein
VRSQHNVAIFITRGACGRFFVVFGDGAVCDVDAVGSEFVDEFVVGDRVGFVFGVDELFEFRLDGGPGHGFAILDFGAAGEEIAEVVDAQGFGCIFRARRGR